MTSALVANITSNKYIVFLLTICARHDNKYNYNKITLQIILKFQFLCEKKFKQLNYFGYFCEHLEYGKRI